MEVVECPRVQVVRAQAPLSCLPSPKCRGQSSPDEEVFQHPDWRKGKARWWFGAGSLCPQPWPALRSTGIPLNSCHVTRCVPGGTVCGARLFSRKLCLGGEEPVCRVGAAPGLKQVILHHHQKLLPKTAVESLTGLIPTPPTSCRLSFPFCRGGSPCVPCRAAAGAS